LKSLSIAVLVGSLRKGSLTRRGAEALIKLSPWGGDMKSSKSATCRFHNQDLDDGTPPAAWLAFRDKIKSFDAELFATPEITLGSGGPRERDRTSDCGAIASPPAS